MLWQECPLRGARTWGAAPRSGTSTPLALPCAHPAGEAVDGKVVWRVRSDAGDAALVEAMAKYILTTGGGYFFVPPPGDTWIDALFRS